MSRNSGGGGEFRAFERNLLQMSDQVRKEREDKKKKKNGSVQIIIVLESNI